MGAKGDGSGKMSKKKKMSKKETEAAVCSRCNLRGNVICAKCAKVVPFTGKVIR